MTIKLANVTLDETQSIKAHVSALRAALRDAYRREIMRRAPHLYSADELTRCGVVAAPLAVLPSKAA